ncbi:LysR substrate-binding domain-containing protein, partial [Salmonella enterica]|uniref:LysR substrate-binding domain-containing protein n=1 Tax=Salmonella enterica TaxID=28901 RepID=UPI001F175473
RGGTRRHRKMEEKVRRRRLRDLFAGRVDVVEGRIAGGALHLRLNYRVLYAEPVCFVARPHHPLAARAQIAWSGLAHWRWRGRPIGAPIRNRIVDSLVRNRATIPGNNIRSALMDVITKLVKSQHSISSFSSR